MNDIIYPTRIGLHPSQKDTTPDLTWATPGLTKSWVPYSTTWGSDHLPILIKFRGKRVRYGRNKKQCTHLNWTTFRDRLLQYDSPKSLETMAEIIRNSSAAAVETITCDEDSPTLDNHLANLWKRMEYLTQLYRSTGRRHNLLRRIRNQYKVINQYQKELSHDNWLNLCHELGKTPGYVSLWKLYRSLGDKKRSKTQIISNIMLTSTNPVDTEESLLKSFFPHASLTPPSPLPKITVQKPCPDLESHFTIAELCTAIRQGRPKSAPGHDGIQ